MRGNASLKPRFSIDLKNNLQLQGKGGSKLGLTSESKRMSTQDELAESPRAVSLSMSQNMSRQASSRNK